MPPKQPIGNDVFSIFREMMDERFDSLDKNIESLNREILLNRENGKETKDLLGRHTEREDEDRGTLIDEIQKLRISLAEMEIKFMSKDDFKTIAETVEANRMFIVRLKWALLIIGTIVGAVFSLFWGII